MSLDRKQSLLIVLGVVCLLLVAFVLGVYMPLLNEHKKIMLDMDKVNKDIKLANSFIEKYKGGIKIKYLKDESQIVLAIDEITKAGQSFDVKFISIKPEEIEKVDNIPYSRMPIEISVVSDYNNLGLFLARLRELESSSLTIRNFTVERNAALLPLVQSVLRLEVYLKNG